MNASIPTIERLASPASDGDIRLLAALLVSAVESGAAVSFLLPLTSAEAEKWWRNTISNASANAVFLVARDWEGICGTVQLQPAWEPNQPHRAEIAKLMVHPRCRRGGLGTRLMTAIEDAAKELGFGLLTLDTKKGSSAEQLYRRLGWAYVGTIPAFALDPDRSAQHDDVIFYKELDPRVAQRALVSNPRNALNESSISVIEANLSQPEHQEATLHLLNAYAMDPMGDGRPMSGTARRDVIAGLREHPTTLVFLSYLDSGPVGLAICFRGFSTFAARPLVNISDYFVFPQHRGLGIGRKLISAIEQRARELGCCRLTLEVQENNHNARRVYAAAGFAQAVYVPEAGGLLYLCKNL